MKSKKFNGKLSLNKKTIAHLNDDDMNAVNGGLSPTVDVTNCASNCLCGTLAVTCPTVDDVSCPPTRKICW